MNRDIEPKWIILALTVILTGLIAYHFARTY